MNSTVKALVIFRCVVFVVQLIFQETFIVGYFDNYSILNAAVFIL